MWEKISKFLFKRSSDCIGIDIGTGAIKIVEIAWENGRPVLKNFGIKDLPLNTIEDGNILDTQVLTDTLHQLIATNGSLSKNVVVAVGGRNMFARELIFPTLSQDELREAIKWDLEKYVPYAPESYYFDFAILGKGDSENEMKVLIVASQHEFINNLITIIKNLGLRLVAIDIEPLALYKTINSAENAMIIDIGALISQVTVFQKGNPVLIRNIPIGGQRCTEVVMEVQGLEYDEAEKFKQNELDLLLSDAGTEDNDLNQQVERLFTEFTRDIRRTAEYYQQQNKDVVIDKVFLTGGGSKIKNLDKYMAKHLEMPVIIHNPLDNIKYSRSFNKTYLKTVGSQLGIALGLALRGGEE